MPVRYSFTGNLIHMSLEGTYTPDDIIEMYRAALGDASFPENARFLLDVRKSLELAKRKPDDIRIVAEFFAEHSDRVSRRCAIVATEPVHFGLGRMGAVFAELSGAEVRVFSSYDEAVSWLGASTDVGAESP